MTLEGLEDRVVLSTSLPISSAAWTALGPAPIVNTALPGGWPSSGRVSAIAADASDPNTIFLGTPGGGVWKTIDGGNNWVALTDGQPTLFIGAITIAPSNPNIIYAGTGDPNFFNAYTGQGVLKSTDGGDSWVLQNANGKFSGRVISRIVVDPANPSVVFAAVSGGGPAVASGAINGNAFNGGIWKSTDGGGTWINTTASIDVIGQYTDLEMDPSNPQVLFASIGTPGGGGSNGVYKTVDGGGAWTLVGGGLPSGFVDGRISLAVAPTSPGTVFASIVGTGAAGSSPLGTLFKMMRSTDNGTTWIDLTPNTPDYFGGGTGQFDTALAVDPANASIVYAGGESRGAVSGLIESIDGGLSWQGIDVGADGNGPARNVLTFSFDAAGHLLSGTNGGIFRLDNRNPGPPSAVAWSNLNGNLQIANFNGIALDPSNINVAYGGATGTGTEKFNDSPQWDQIRGEAGGVVRVDPTNPFIVYHTFGTGHGAGFFERSQDGGQTWVSASVGINIGGPVPDFSNPFPPFVIDPSNPARLLLGTNRVYQTLNRGGLWTPISTPGANGWTSAGNINSIAISPSDPNTIYAATSDGGIEVTRDGGATWVNRSIPFVADGMNGLVVDPLNPAIAYITRSGNFLGNGRVYRTLNAGQNWVNITGNLPDLPSWSLAVDARQPSSPILFVGTDAGVYTSTDQGTTWSRFGAGLPNAQVLSLELNTTLNVLAAGTNGRGLFEIKEINPLQVQVVSPQNLVEGTPLNNILVATFFDSDGPEPVGNYTAIINWGDGTPTSTGTIANNGSGQFTVNGTHTYRRQGNYTLTVTVSDSEGNVAIGSTAVVVADAPLTPINGFTVSSVEGQPVGGTIASFLDGNPFDLPGDFTVLINWGDGHTSLGTVTPDPNVPGKFNVGGANTYLEVGQYNITIQVSDQGGSSTTITGTATVVDAPLNAVGQTFTAVEGLSFLSTVATFTSGDVNAVPTDFAAVIDWGDGTTPTLGVVNATGSSVFVASGQHTYLEQGTFTVTVTIIDHSNNRAIGDPTNRTTTAVSTANVLDAPLTATGNTVLGTEGQPLSGFGQPDIVVATFTDANPGAQVTDYASVLINWGDGQLSPGTITALGGGKFSVSGNHTYVDEGDFTISVPIVSTDGRRPVGDPANSRATATATASIVDAPLSPIAASVSGSAGVPLVPAGQPLPTVGSFTDANPFSSLSDFTAVIDWGDGTPSVPDVSPGVISQPGLTGSTYLVSGSHTYTRAGTFTVLITVTDVGGATTTITSTAVIGDADLTGTIANFPALTEGGTFIGTVATFTSANFFAATTDFIVPIDWGDGTTSLGTVTVLPGGGGKFSVFGSHKFDTQGTFPVTVTVISLGGSRVVLTGTVTVSPAQIIPGSGTTVEATEGTAFTGLVATFSQASTSASPSDFTATINWGDGNTSGGQIVSLGQGTFGVTGTNTYTTEGSFTIAVQVSDVGVGGGSATVNSTADVADAAVTATGTSISALLGQTFSGVVANFSDANAFSTASGFTAAINWGDGHTSTGQIVSLGNGRFQVTGSNQFSTPGQFTVVVTIQDVGGGTTAAGGTAHVVRGLNGGVTGGQTITRNTRPSFNGGAEPGSTVQVFAQPLGSSSMTLIGQTKATSQGLWSLASSTALAQGRYTIIGAMNDAFGNRIQTVQLLPKTSAGPLTIDTTGPSVVSATFNPAQGKVVITYRDSLSGMNPAALVNSANTTLTRPGSSRPTRPSAISIVPGASGSGLITATLTFPRSGRVAAGTYVLTISGANVTDRAGNRMIENTFVTFPQTTNSPNPNFVAAFNVNSAGQSSAAQPFVSAAERRAAAAYLRWVLARTRMRNPR